ncbi:unnamed protein product [Cuscuta epithymum]|uniref:DNL-type domain-containing protein n=1 Tax=Cuscuta epithymum TaxID=186058 RepID=A0AAV0CHR2_9ASTE|nr:unnamed protein product [Cuscuta epithymum]
MNSGLVLCIHVLCREASDLASVLAPMLSRWLCSRVLPILGSRRDQSSCTLREHSYLSLSRVAAAFSIHEYLRRTIQTHSQLTNLQTKEILKEENCSSMANGPTGNELREPEMDSYSAVKSSTSSGLKVSSRHDLAMIYTCKVCETRSVKTVCRDSYEKGVVVVRCGGCNNLHLIADRLGWFGQPGSIEDLLAARGEEVKKGSIDTLNLTLEDLAGKKV